jgi:hypothetical protein
MQNQRLAYIGQEGPRYPSGKKRPLKTGLFALKIVVLRRKTPDFSA